MPEPRERPFRFGVQCSSLPRSDPRSWAELARRCEDLGYDLLTVADHFDDQLAPVPAIMAAADATTRLRVGSMVFCNDYKHPVVLAKEAATIDVLSGGRFELGLGAGWMASDYKHAGLTFDPPGRRLDRLAEAVVIIKQLMGASPCSFDGHHYRVRDLDGTPKPLQRPHPPILIGGGGRKALTLAAREADIVGLSTVMTSGVIDSAAARNGTAAATDQKLAWIREAAGTRWSDLEIEVRVHLAVVTAQRDETADALATAFELTAEEALASPHALCGTVEQLVDALLERRERWGISSVGLSVDALDAFAPVVERLAGK